MDEDVKSMGSSGYIDFDPVQYQLQHRYRPLEGDTAFSNRWYKRFFLGAGAGPLLFSSNNSPSKVVTDIHIYAGYHITPIHSLRLGASMTNITLEHEANKHLRSLRLGVDWLANLSTFAAGYNPDRRINLSTVIGGGVRYTQEGLPSKISPYAQMGLNASLMMSRNMSFFLEPYVGVMRNAERLFNYPNPDRYTLFYGVTGGLQLEPFTSHGVGDTYAAYTNNRIFADASFGMGMPLGGAGVSGTGNAYSASFGYWINNVVGLRLGVNLQHLWHGKTSAQVARENVTRLDGEAIGSGRLEFVFSPLNISRRLLKNADSRRFDLNVSAGGDYGYIVKAGIPNTRGRGFRTYYFGITAALQALYKVNEGAYIYVEPRYLNARYSIPYVNTNNNYSVSEGYFNLSVGTRFYYNARKERVAFDKTFERNFWMGVDGGIMNWVQTSRIQGGGVSPSVAWNLGYDFHPLASVRLQLNYQRLTQLATGRYSYESTDGNVASSASLIKNSYNTMDARLSYMLNLSNLWSGVNAQRKLNLFWTVGPALTYSFSKDSKVVGEVPAGMKDGAYLVQDGCKHKISPAVSTSFMSSLRFTPQWELTAEALGQYNIRPAVIPGENPRLNRLKYGLSVGAVYHFIPYDEHEGGKRGDYQLHPWQRKWFGEFSYGWVSSVGSGGSVAHMGGNNWRVGVGKWLLPMLGVRANVESIRGFWKEMTSKNYNAYAQQLSLNMGVELLADLMQLTHSQRAKDVENPWGVNVGMGVQYGFIRMAHSDGVYKRQIGFTASLDVLRRMAPSTYVFVEPRIYLPSHYIPGDALGRSAVDKMFSVNVGVRIARPDAESRKLMNEDPANIFEPHFWAALDLGGATGLARTKYTDGRMGWSPSVSVSGGYDFTPKHTLRIQTQYAHNRVSFPDKGGLLQEQDFGELNFRALYMINISSLWQGTNHIPRFSVYGEVGPGLAATPSRGETSFSVNTGILMAYKIHPRFDITAEATGQYNTNYNLRASIEKPRVSATEMNFAVGTRYHFMEGWKHDFDMGVYSSQPWHRNWFVEGSVGMYLPFGTKSALSHNGASWYGGFGYWMSSFLAVRWGMTARYNSWGSKVVPARYESISGQMTHEAYTRYHTETAASGRMEVVISPLNFIKSRAEKTVSPTWDLNVSAGLELGFNRKTHTPDGSLDHFTTGFTCALQGLYRIDNATQIYIEPRYTAGSYDVDNKNFNITQTVADRGFSVSVGARITRPLQSKRAKWEENSKDEEKKDAKYPVLGWWCGADFGTSVLLQCDQYKMASSFQPTVSLNGGYDFSYLHGLRLQGSYSKFSLLRPDQPYSVEVAGRTFNFKGNMDADVHQMDVRLLYQLNLFNLWTGQRRARRFNVYWTVGPGFSYCLADKIQLSQGEVVVGDLCYKGKTTAGKADFNISTGILCALRVSSKWDVTAESLGQCSFTRDYSPLVHKVAGGNVKIGFSVGTRYHF